MASDATNHMAVGLVPLPSEQGGKAFVKDSCLQDQKCIAPTFDFSDTLVILSPHLHLM